MSIASLAGIFKIFSGSEPTAEEQAQLAKEAMLMTLSRATAADTNIKDIEVEKVREVLLARTSEDFPAADVRVAAHSSIYEKAPLEKYLASTSKKLGVDDRMGIAEALRDVVNADGRVSDREITFFNDIVEALNLTPAQLMGLKTEE
ncbi:MAG: TerB family tellurite resistance protein [Pseudomonadota bacterium]|nr:TerB family tellurite resistance protein [Pseudomonadota bacterium]